MRPHRNEVAAAGSRSATAWSLYAQAHGADRPEAPILALAAEAPAPAGLGGCSNFFWTFDAVSNTAPVDDGLIAVESPPTVQPQDVTSGPG